MEIPQIPIELADGEHGRPGRDDHAVFDRDGGLHGSASPGQPHENLANKEGLLRSRPVRCDPADGAPDVTVPVLVRGLRPAGGVAGPGADSARDANWTAAGYA